MSKETNIRVIVNADDLGISLDVNRQIEMCINKGVVSSTTLLVNAPAFEDGVRIAKQYPQVSVGIHLNLIEFAPLTNVDVFRQFGLIGDDGNFIEGAIFVINCRDERLKKAVFEEWDAQICKFKSAGIIPTHIDSHQHTHAIIALQDVLCKLMDKHGIKRVRRKMEPSIRYILKGRKQSNFVQLDKSKAVVPKKQNAICRRLHFFVAMYYSSRWNRQMAKHYVMTDDFCAFRFFDVNQNIKRSGKVYELMCHPGHIAYQKETEALMGAYIWLTGCYKLVSYKEV